MSLMKSIFGDESLNVKDLRNEHSKVDLFRSIPSITHSKKAIAGQNPSSTEKNEEVTKDKNPTSEERQIDNEATEECKIFHSDEELNSKEDQNCANEYVKEVSDNEEKDAAREERRLDEEKRTIFVGNLPSGTSRKVLEGIFKDCGKVTSSRFRSVAVAGVKLPPDQAGNQNLMRKVCVNTGKLLTESPKNCSQGYVVFESLDSVEKALKLNNTIYQTHTLRVDYAKPTIDSGRSVFVGNLPYGAGEETLRKHFLDGLGYTDDHDGEPIISGVRIIRDKETQKCKGFGYVTFRDASFVPIALDLHKRKYMKRELRVLISGKSYKRNGQSDLTNSSINLRGAASLGNKAYTGKRKFQTDGATSESKMKRRRHRIVKKVGSAAKSGISKRAATDKKLARRVKKLEKRASKGMGKKRH